MRRTRSRSRIIIVVITCFVLFVAGSIVYYKDAVFQRGNPLPYISKMVALSDSVPYAKVFDDQDVYILSSKSGASKELIKHIESAYGATYREQLGGNVLFDSGGKTIFADIEAYWRYYEVWVTAEY